MKDKKKKERPEKYEPKVAINGTFEDVIKIALGKAPAKKAETPKKK